MRSYHLLFALNGRYRSVIVWELIVNKEVETANIDTTGDYVRRNDNRGQPFRGLAENSPASTLTHIIGGRSRIVPLHYSTHLRGDRYCPSYARK